MLLIRTDHPHDALAPDDLALVTNPFHRRSNLHQIFLTIRPRPLSAPDISTSTRSPTSTLTKLRSIRSATCAWTMCPAWSPSSFTRYIALGSTSVTTPTGPVTAQSLPRADRHFP